MIMTICFFSVFTYYVRLYSSATLCGPDLRASQHGLSLSLMGGEGRIFFTHTEALPSPFCGEQGKTRRGGKER